MPQKVIVFCWIWPFIVTMVGGAIAARLLRGMTDEEVYVLILMTLAGNIPGVAASVFKLWPNNWPEPKRALATFIPTALIVFFEFILAAKLFAAVYLWCGGPAA